MKARATLTIEGKAIADGCSDFAAPSRNQRVGLAVA
jgi:hypothetical protein